MTKASLPSWLNMAEITKWTLTNETYFQITERTKPLKVKKTLKEGKLVKIVPVVNVLKIHSLILALHKVLFCLIFIIHIFRHLRPLPSDQYNVYCIVLRSKEISCFCSCSLHRTVCPCLDYQVQPRAQIAARRMTRIRQIRR